MYYYNDIAFENEAAALEAMGSIKMYYSGERSLGDGDKRLRGYVLLSDDISKLSNITNAADGSKALVTDTGKGYILCSGQWREWTGKSGFLLTWNIF